MKKQSPNTERQNLDVFKLKAMETETAHWKSEHISLGGREKPFFFSITGTAQPWTGSFTPKLNNMHTSQLELTQSNLRKEKETALVELREMLNDKRAQEVAILQSRHQLDWEKIKEQCLKEKEDLKSKYQQELGIKIWE